jgi:hypothetical protein
MDDASKQMDDMAVSGRRRDDFVGQHHIIAPDVVRAATRHPLLSGLLPTASGFFPHAEGTT